MSRTGDLTVDIQDVVPAFSREYLDALQGGYVWDFNQIFEIPGNIAGGVGSGDAFADRRTVTGTVTITKASDTTVNIVYNLHVSVFDTIDFIPGNTTDIGLVEYAFVPAMALLEENDWAYDVPFQVDFDVKPVTETVTVSMKCDDEKPPEDDNQQDPQDDDNTTGVRSFDPNDKIGPAGSGDAHYIIAGSLMPYSIYYENDPDSGATAPAQVVRVVDTLDADLDLTTFELGDINLYGDFTVDVPAGLQYYQDTVDLRPEGNDLLVRVTAGLDSNTRTVTWLFESLDPDTLLPPDDAMAGFLPVNDSSLHNGEGHLSYTIRPLAGLVSGTQITNQAFNYFDTNDPVPTPTTLQHHRRRLADQLRNGPAGTTARRAVYGFLVGPGRHGRLRHRQLHDLRQAGRLAVDGLAGRYHADFGTIHRRRRT